MKILHVIETLDPNFGGPSVSAPSLAAAQKALGHDVTIFCYRNSAAQEVVEKRNRAIVGYSDLSIVEVQTGGRIETMFAAKASKMLDRYVQGCDVVHIQGIWRPILLKACKLAATHSKKYVVAPRGMLDPWSLRQSPVKKKLAMVLGWRAALNNSHFIHALNRAEKNLISLLNLDCPIKIFPNGVFSDYFANLPQGNEFYSKYPDLNERPYILFLSRLHYKKGLDYLVEAYKLFCKKNSSVDLVVAGPDGGALADFRERVSKYGLESRVHVVGAIYGNEKLAALVHAKCFCLPSRQEGFSMAITEALACSTPVVISENCNFPEVGEANAGLVVPLDPEQLAEALLLLASDDKKNRAMGEAAKTLVFERYLWEKIAEGVVAAYSSSA